jgi:1,4-dihydroxy-6-naphthoate synthase
MKYTLGFSPCPNDTFIFDALVNGKIDTGNFNFEVIMEDVETLNRMALSEELDISKISYGVLSRILPLYKVLNAGSALGMGVGPLLVTSRPTTTGEINDMSVAIPGMNTTAHMLFSIAFPEAKKKKFMLFSSIEDAVIRGEVDAGVIIHENRFTYQQKGLHQVLDLGDYWEQHTGGPIPLGGIVMNRKYDHRTMEEVNRLIMESLLYARRNYPELTDFVKNNSQEMEEGVMRQHIDLYVNDYSVDLGQKGRAAVWQLLEVAEQIFPQSVSGSFEVFV